MKKNIAYFTKGIFLGSIALGLFLVAGSLANFSASAHGGSECSQSEYCNLVDNPGNSGTYDNNSSISETTIKAGTEYFSFHSGNSDDGCYKVEITNKTVSWQKYGDGPSCKDVSHLEVWRQKDENPPSNPPQTPPSFPSCSSFTTQGDWVTTDSNYNHIPGQEATILSSDDVYQIENGNFVQCLCPAEDTNGVQTNWWKVGDIADEVKNYFTSNGWYFEDGGAWNLLHTKYLAKNTTYTCRVPEPSPTGEPSPTATPQPTTTPQPTVTPTPGPSDDNPSRCIGLSASPTEGSAPLTVKFTGSGFDKNGPILEYEFNFGDGSGFQPQTWKTTDDTAAHRYENSGTYIASLKVKDQGGQWRDGNDSCKVTVTVDGKPQVLGTSTPSTLPATGGSALMGLAMVAFGSLGTFFYKRFELA
ncbi:MAG: PKD domain containing protein [Candidatus Woesebacteria bacterium GW2011_GWA1_39_8]|jgi:hypothetical protein|uniref:PKD domain containing protein n=1 Tax=Candidatus Woesebacteria bacterium GW2011_GWA1_39_8 TaxID=1618552 RepID=A0A0G0S207_9BACT|nr:MAG: PKD domain containing protein [Candidatus Woesebacteria bacterium GW2011_GWA1_39_8]